MSANAAQGATDTPSTGIREKLVEAAYRCLDRYGVQQTTMEGVASAAGCSRQTVYNNFATKNDLVTEICLLESAKLQEEITRSIRRKQGLADKMTESIMVTLRVGAENPYIRRLIEPADVRARTTEKDDPVHAMQRRRWEPLLREAIDSGQMASDLDIDEVVSWLTMAQMAMLLKFDLGHLDKQRAERVVRRFIVAPLLHQV